jgi:hypothetical protein
MLAEYEQSLQKVGYRQALRRRLNLDWETYCQSSAFVSAEYGLVLAEHCFYDIEMNPSHFRALQSSLASKGLCVILLCERSSDVLRVQLEMRKGREMTQELAQPRSAEDVEAILLEIGLRPDVVRVETEVDVSCFSLPVANDPSRLLSSWLLQRDYNTIVARDVRAVSNVVRSLTRKHGSRTVLEHPVRIITFHS